MRSLLLVVAALAAAGCPLSHELPAPRDAGPDLAGSPRHVIAIGVGMERSCAVRAEGTVACWGAGPLGDGSTDMSPVPVDVVGVSDATAVAVGFPDEMPSITCIVRRGGGVACWGDNRAGQLGDGTTTNTTTPVDVVGVDDAVAVAVGATTACALRASGAIACWGGPMLGLRPDDAPLTATDIDGLDEAAVSVDVCQSHACALLASGRVACWGYNTEHALGRPNFIEGGIYTSTTALEVPGVAGALAMAVGGGFSEPESCVIDPSSQVRCWGLDFWLPPALTHPDPHLVPGLTHAVAFRTNAMVGCALNDDGSVTCLGEAGFGSELGIVRDDDTSVPTYVPASLMHLPANDIVQIGVGWYAHVCVLRANGDVLCTGHNDYGQLGDGTLTTRTEPVRVVGL